MTAPGPSLGDRVAERVRAWLPGIAVVVALLLAATDYPLGWAVWVEHPFFAALVAGLVIVFLTATVIDAFLRRREAARWIDINRAAATAFWQVFSDSYRAAFALLGFDAGPFPLAVDHTVSAPRLRAAELLPTDLDWRALAYDESCTGGISWMPTLKRADTGECAPRAAHTSKKSCRTPRRSLRPDGSRSRDPGAASAARLVRVRGIPITRRLLESCF